ncbi:hypothetical cytosolic protein [Coxiella burnetii RSA 493]|uniref:Hypothetical cytosolic protein n=1 Tax=Coxiella burnetii (strain RSA 493 / Nine Mile phase I) TaxID=227377 RepID=B5QSG9_COXBU|nr:hypothetical cytosolic protein [Coxiella burnetii RSA 493]BBL39562.1 hypothetical cytosolic protein [Coxiella burnetii]
MWVMIWYGPCRYPPVVKREKLKTRRPPARSSAILLKYTKNLHGRVGRTQIKGLRKTPMRFS